MEAFSWNRGHKSEHCQQQQQITTYFCLWPSRCCVVDSFTLYTAAPHGSFNLHVSADVCVHLRVFMNNVCPQDSWEIVEGLRGGFGTVLEPQKQEGYMLKRRKWPMKGWHKVWSDLCDVLKGTVHRKKKNHSLSTHHSSGGGVGEVFDSTKHFWSLRGKQRCSQIQSFPVVDI